jgi:ribosome maturation factor RimP
MVLITTHQPVNGRKRFQGRLIFASENEVTLELREVPEEESLTATIEWENIRAARLFIDFEAL